jgi:hypothetical protein
MGDSKDAIRVDAATMPAGRAATYAPVYTSHGHDRKTHATEMGEAFPLCGARLRFDWLLWNEAEPFSSPEKQFLLDPDGHGCLVCQRILRKRLTAVDGEPHPHDQIP